MRTSSKSTDKLALLTEALKTVPPEVLMKVKTFELGWVECFEGAVWVPVIKVEFHP